MVTNQVDIQEGEPGVDGQDWQRFAYDCAQDARENHSHQPRGIWYFEDLDVVVYFNNQDGLAQESEITRLRALLQAEGVEELGYATYSRAREAVGATCAIILKPTWGQMSLVEHLVRRLSPSQLQERQPW